MQHIFEFSNWNQLSGLKSFDYPNLEIRVTQYNSKDLTGTEISIVDIRTDAVYFAGFIRIVESTLLNPDSCFLKDDLIEKINSYGFNISHIERIELPPNTITILNGLQELGYDYITIEYLTEDNRDLLNEDSTRKKMSKHIVATRDLLSYSDFAVVSNAPNFNWEDFRWMEPNTPYSISLLLNPKGT